MAHDKLRNVVLVGDALAQLRTLPADSVHCCVTSPPYWGLRDYGTRNWFGGDPACAHDQGVNHAPHHPGQVEQTKWADAQGAGKGGSATTASCSKCGAWWGQLGLEPTPEAYVQNIVAIFREVRRALHPSGTLWLNLGDSYAGGGGFSPNSPSNLAGSKQTTQRGAKPGGLRPQGTLKAKDLVGIPWMVAFALRADGWYLRSDIIWAKGNCMPESVTDRPTRSHEYIFLLAKGPRYFYDQDAIREPLADYTRPGGHAPSTAGGSTTNGIGSTTLHQMRTPRPQLQRALEIAAEKGLTQEHLDAVRATGLAEGGTKVTETMSGTGRNTPEVLALAAEAKEALGSYYREFLAAPEGRNKRSVWQINSQPYAEAHFATFPPELPRLCILAGTSQHGVCPHCNAPWERITEPCEGRPDPTQRTTKHYNTRDRYGAGNGGNSGFDALAERMRAGMTGTRTIGWQPTCGCPDNQPQPAIVLDPFSGSGTTLATAKMLRRDFLGIELNPEYAKLIEGRTQPALDTEAQRQGFDAFMADDD